MLDKLKEYKDYIIEALLLIVTGAFLFEKSRANSNEALVAEQKTQEAVAALQKTVDVNDGKLAAEEDKRSEIKKEADNDKADDSSDPSTFLNKR